MKFVWKLGVGATLLAAATASHAEQLLFDNGRLFISARLNGVETEALLDSGAEASIADPALASRAHLPEGQPIAIRGSGGTATAHVVENATIEALGLTIRPEALVVTDLTDISKRLAKRPVHLIVGREAFDAARLLIDIEKGNVDVLPPDYKPDGVELKLTEHAGIESIPVTANGNAAQAEFDLGNGSGVLVSRALATKLKLSPIAQSSGGGIGGEVRRDIVVIDRLEVAGMVFRNVRAAVDEQPNANDLNVGTGILKNFVITTDFSARTIWLAAKAK